jgi:hypothetical protein
MLKKELDFIDSSIRKIDDIANSIKNWAILVWTGSIAAILSKPELYGYVYFTAISPLVFMLVDAHWRKVQRRFTYRQGQISEFMNSEKLDKAFETGKLGFYIFDPFARKSRKSTEYQRFISIGRILSFPTVSWMYVGLAILSLGMAAVLHFAPPLKESRFIVIEELATEPDEIGVGGGAADAVQELTSRFNAATLPIRAADLHANSGRCDSPAV